MVGDLKTGQIVEIPFRNKKVQAVVEKITKTTPVAPSRLKEITKLFTDEVLFIPEQFKLASWLSQYYHVSLGLIIKSMLPSIPKRKIKTKVKNLLSSEFTAKKIKLPNLKQQNYFQYSEASQEVDFIYSLLQSSKEQSLIIIPDLFQLARAGEYIDKRLKEKTVVIHSGLNKNQFFNIWLKILTGEAKIIIGTRQAVFLPFKKLENIIIKDEASDDLKQWDQNPRYDARTTAEQLIVFHKQTKLITLSPAPRMKTFKLIKDKKINLITPKNSVIKKTIVSLRDETRSGNYSLISYQLEQAILDAKEKKQKVALYLNRRGVASSVLCSNCGYIFNCPHCLLPLPLHSAGQLKCHHCDYKTGMLPKCPNCGGVKFKFSGQGTEKLAEELKKLWPGVKVLRLDKDNETQNDSSKIEQYDICLGTDILFKKLKAEDIGLVGILLMDNLLFIPNYQAKERLWQILQQISNFTAGTINQQLILQTFSPENPLFELWQANQNDKFYQDELTDRKELNYPPFSQITKLIYQSNSQKDVQNNTNQLYQKLTNKAKSIRLNTQISEPQSVYTSRIRGRWRQVIIIRANTLIDPLLELVPENWLIDVDPINLI